MKLFVLILFLFLLSLLYSCTTEMELVENQKSNYRIVLSTDASSSEQRAAEEMQKYIKDISNTKLEIVTDNEPAEEYEILIGKNNRIDALNINIDIDLLEKDGFTIRTVEKKLIIAGGSHKGTLYGVYTFLEDYLGCKMYTPDVKVILKSSDISIPTINITQVPKIKYRELHIPSARFSKEFCDWHKLHHYSVRESTYGSFVHTFHRLISPNDYFKDHPEYFSEVNGIRVSDKQLCLTNPDVYKLVVKKLKEKMKKRPEALVWDVSQNDDFGNCTCDECSKLDKKYESPAGSLIHFVNKIARAFPNKTISTLAYQYTRKAPVSIKPEPNVMVVLCTIECDRNIPIAKNENDLFNRDIKEWSALTNNIKIWDYVVQFRNYIDPFPNFRVLQPNIKMFVEYGVTSLFEQGSGNSKSDLHELKAYVLAKLMWNPNENVNAIIDEFLQGYYGNAASHMKDYFIKIHDAIEESGKSLIIYGYPSDGMDSYLTPKLLKEYGDIFDLAEKSVAKDSKYLQRVKIARLPLEFAILEISKRNASEDLYIFKISGDNVTVNEEMKKRLDKFVTLANKAEIKHLHERGRSPDEYMEEMLDYFKNGMMIHKAYKKDVKIVSVGSAKYLGDGSKTLTDGVKGEANFTFNWLGYEAEEFEAIVDLENELEINSIRTDFLQEAKSWVWLPRSVGYFVSSDGENFTKVGKVNSKADEKQDGTFIESFVCNVNKTTARYLKVKTNSFIICPKWHIGHNFGTGKAWVFIDEIVVK